MDHSANSFHILHEKGGGWRASERNGINCMVTGAKQTHCLALTNIDSSCCPLEIQVIADTHFPTITITSYIHYTRRFKKTPRPTTLMSSVTQAPQYRVTPWREAERVERWLNPTHANPSLIGCRLNISCCSQCRPLTGQCFVSNNNWHFFSLGLLLEFPFFPTKIKVCF